MALTRSITGSNVVSWTSQFSRLTVQKSWCFYVCKYWKEMDDLIIKHKFPAIKIYHIYKHPVNITQLT